MRKILVTGGAGFIGSELVRQAAALGFKIIVVDKLTYAGDLERLKAVRGKIVFYRTDIAHRPKVMDIFKKERPQALLHFAAESHVDRSIDDDAEFVRTNILGTQNLLTISRQAGIEKFIHVSTDEVYGEAVHGKFKEDFPLRPNSPYSSSKGAADLLIRAYVRTFKFPAVIVRPSNNYGPWQYPEKFIPVVIYKAMKGQPIPVYAQGQNVREWLHVADCAAAILQVLGDGRVGNVYNIGSGREKKNIDVVKNILRILGRPQSLISFVADRPGHDWRYALDSGKIHQELSWKAEIGFEAGIANTVEWYRKNFLWLEKKAAYLKKYWQKVYR